MRLAGCATSVPATSRSCACPGGSVRVRGVDFVPRRNGPKEVGSLPWCAHDPLPASSRPPSSSRGSWPSRCLQPSPRPSTPASRRRRKILRGRKPSNGPAPSAERGGGPVLWRRATGFTAGAGASPSLTPRGNGLNGAKRTLSNGVRSVRWTRHELRGPWVPRAERVPGVWRLYSMA